MYRCALFDIDNTLLVKKPTIAEMVYELAARENPALTMDEAEKAYAESELWQGQQIQKENETGVRMADEEYLENVTGIYRRALGLGEKACQSLTELFGRDYKKEYQLMPGAKELLGRLQAEGLSLGIVSNNHSGVRKVLAGMGLEGFFGCMVISEEVFAAGFVFAGFFSFGPFVLPLFFAALGPWEFPLLRSRIMRWMSSAAPTLHACEMAPREA